MVVVKKKSIIVSLFDIFFIMALCFATLLSSMLLNGAVIVGDNAAGIEYEITLFSIIIVAGILFFYLFYLFRHTESELRRMIKKVYDNPGKKSALPADASS